MRVPRRAGCAVVCCSLLVTPGVAAGASSRSSARPDVTLVTSRGIFRGPASAFRPDAPLTRQQLAHAVARLTRKTETTVPDGRAPVTIAELDATLVRALGLGAAAHRFYLGAARAGFAPPRRFGTEVVARLLGLRTRGAGASGLERLPQQAATLAEGAHSLAQILRFDRPGARLGSGLGWSTELVSSKPGVWRVVRPPRPAGTEPGDPAGTWIVQTVDEASKTFVLPAPTAWQRRILARALSYIGFPYVWGGTGGAPAGFDCSGFVWRVYKLTPYAHERALAAVLRGRTTMQMSAEVPRRERVGLDDLEPADVLFFGKGRRSRPAQVDHAGIYLGNGWFVHSSGNGVALAMLEGGYRSSFAWARRPLAEAGLE